MDISLKFLLFAFIIAYNVYSSYALAIDPLMSSVETSASALRAQSERLKVIAQNIANEDSTGSTPGEKPYRKKTIHFKARKNPKQGTDTIVVSKYGESKEPFKMIFDPSHPAANSDGYVLFPNVDKAIELRDAKEAQYGYNANLSAIEISRSMLSKTLDLLK